ncbi:bifunctional metallophosphatase/5'-nucleotidase [Paenibacillus turpanensis]|uniref:bifunctional metallophosphatase/5'-nucleotidase n=1 Tax=Paenibacillus turpanensis TaxID=2689078 RepID=UPI001FB6DFE4|nr:bifunctional UDP-sugar hydrolase/5'-nucleotidase [Paenibacillus turpanensis]
MIHTNDIHSHFEQMPKVSSVIRSIKERIGGEPSLLLDIGDHMDRMRTETEGSEGAANIAVMNETGYDAAVPGNNEGLTFTVDMLSDALGKKADFPYLAANMELTSTGVRPDWLVPHRLLNCGGVRIALIGVTIDFTTFYSQLGWTVTDPIEAALREAEEVRSTADIVVVLSHMGLHHDERLASEAANRSGRLIDVIIGGHTHHLLEKPLRIGHSAIFGAGKFGQYVGHITLTYDETDRRVFADGEVISTEGFPADSHLEMVIRSYRLQSEQKLSGPIVTLQEPVENSWQQESAFGNLLAQSLRQWTQAEIGLVNAGQLLDGLQAGPVSRERLLRVCPSPINPCRMLLRGEDLAEALEEALQDAYIQLPIRGFGFRGEKLGTLCLDGMQVTYCPSAPNGQRIRSVVINGLPLDPVREYSVGTIDMFTFRIGYLSLAKGTNIRYYLPEFIRDLLADSLHNDLMLRSCREKRWIPQAEA